MSLRDEFKDKTLKNAKEVERQKRQAFEKQFDEFIDEVLVKDFAESVLKTVKTDVRYRVSKGFISTPFFGNDKIVKNELAIGEDSQFGQTPYKSYESIFPISLKEYLENSTNYYSPSSYKYRYKGITFSIFKNEIKVLYIEGLFLGKVKKILTEKLKEEPGLSIVIRTSKIGGEDYSYYITLKYKFVL